MANPWISNGRCVNGIRYALDGAGAGSRNWIEAADVTAEATTAQVIIVAIAFDSDDMNAINGDFYLEWRNETAAGSWSDLGSSGELKWSSSSDLSNGATVVEAEQNGTENCSSMGVTNTNGVEREGANTVTMSGVSSKLVFDLQWAVDMSGADGANGDQYAFRVSESGGGSGVYKTFTALLTAAVAGKIDGTTKNSDRSAAVGGVTVTAYLSDAAGSDPKPIGAHVAQVVSHASTGVYSLTGLASGVAYFLHFYKDDTADLSDGSPEVTAVDA
jgi:hypothetical protein